MIYFDAKSATFPDAKPATLSDLEDLLISVKESVLKHSREYDESSRDHAWIYCAASEIQMAIDSLNHVGEAE